MGDKSRAEAGMGFREDVPEEMTGRVPVREKRILDSPRERDTRPAAVKGPDRIEENVVQ